MKVMPPAGTPVALYARFSSDLQNPRSVEDQIALCREYAARYGWTVVAVYTDSALSGQLMKGRDGLWGLLAGADRGEFALVLAEDLDRLSRTASHTHSIVEELDLLDIDICTVSSGMLSEVEVAFKAVQNAHYLKQLGEKTRRGQQGVVRSGRVCGPVAYGYKKVFGDDGKRGLRAIDEDKAAIVQRIFEDYAKGVSPLKICTELNTQGTPSPRGGQWCAPMLTGDRQGGGFLRNRMYIGEFHYGRTTSKRDRKTGSIKKKAAPQTNHVVAHLPELRIVSDELFQAVQARLEERSKGAFGEQRGAEYLFTGKVACGLCGSSMFVSDGRFQCSGRATKGICHSSRRVRREDLEAAVVAGLKDRLLLPELIGPCLDEYRQEAQRALAEQQKNALSAQKRLKDIEREKANLLDQMRKGSGHSLAVQVLMQELERLERERQSCERELSHKLPDLGLDLEPHAIVGRLKGLVADLGAGLSGEERDAIHAKTLLREMIERIVVHPHGPADGNGAGAVRLTIHGSLTQMLDLADARVGRVILQGSRPKTLLGNATLVFRYWVDVQREKEGFAPSDEGRPERAAIWRLLEQAQVPLTAQAIFAALPSDQPLPREDAAKLKARITCALYQLARQDRARAIRRGRRIYGWVSNLIPISDDAWINRASGVGLTSVLLPTLRVLPPEASVVIIERRSTEPANLTQVA